MSADTLFMIGSHLASAYLLIGLFFSVRWAHDEYAIEGLGLALSILILGPFIWPSVLDRDDKALLSRSRRTRATRAVRQEKARLRKEIDRETARVEMLELNADFRTKMAQLDERRKKAEEYS